MKLSVLLLALASISVNAQEEMCHSDKEWGPPLFRGVTVHIGGNRTKFAESISRHLCNGGNWIEINVACPQTSLTDPSTLSCPVNMESEVREYVDIARCLDAGIQIFLSPFPSHNTETTWQAHIGRDNFNDEGFWNTWFANWGSQMERFAKVANEKHLDMLGVGLELSTPQLKTGHWKELVKKHVRPHFHGRVTYGADKYNEDKVEFWDAVDVIGVDAYHRLATDNKDPSTEQLVTSWGDWVQKLKTLHHAYERKPIVFTEVGYRSMEGTNKCPGCWTTQGEVSLDLQARLFDSLFKAVCTNEFFHGVFVHGWGLDIDKDAEDTNNTGYSIVGKPAEDVLAKWFLAKNVDECRSGVKKKAGECVFKQAKHNAAMATKAAALIAGSTEVAAQGSNAAAKAESVPQKKVAGALVPVV